MDSPQYKIVMYDNRLYAPKCFKPYYKWIVLNTKSWDEMKNYIISEVLNLIINGQSSIHQMIQCLQIMLLSCFKPYYKWIVLNTKGGSNEKKIRK